MASNQANNKGVLRSVSEAMLGWLSFAPSDGAVTLDNASALQNSAIRAAVAVIAEGIAQTPLDVVETYDENGLTRRRKLRDHPLKRLLDRPNPYQTRFEFLEMMAANALLGKGALAIKVRAGGQVRELHPQPHGSWTHQVLADGSHQFVVRLANGGSKTYASSEVVYVHGLSMDGYTGVAAIEVARYAAAIAGAIEKQVLTNTRDHGRPTGFLNIPHTVGPEKIEAIREYWRTNYSSAGKGGIGILDMGATFTPADPITAADAQTIENRRFQIEEIARYFRVHPAFLQTGAAKIDDQILRAHVKHTLMPWFVRFEQALTRDLVNDPSVSFDFDEHELLRGDHKAMGAWLVQMLGSGGTPAIMSVNECRYELGLDPIDEEWATKPLRGGYEASNPTVDIPSDKPSDDDHEDVAGNRVRDDQ